MSDFDSTQQEEYGHVFKVQGLSLETALAGYDPCPNDPYGSTCMPIYQTATFQQPTATEFGAYDYTRSGNPTRDALQNQIALLENSPECQSFCFSTGMAAISAVTRLAQMGDEIIISDDSYGGTYRLVSTVTINFGIKIRFLNLSGEIGVENLKSAISSNTRLVMIESPTNPMQRICDIRALAEVCHENNHPKGTFLSIDNTMLSPVFSRPLEIGADIVIHSATKFLSGHSDTMAGVVTVKNIPDGNNTTLPKTLYFYQNAEGPALAPFDCWLVLRGLKTMSLRVKQQALNAMEIAKRLTTTPSVQQVIYPGLATHPDHALHRTQASGYGSVVCFLTGNQAFSHHIVTNTKLFKITVSFGSVTSLISLPGHMSHASIPEDVRAARAFPEDLIRLCIGIEDPEDLINDLQKAMESFNQAP
jgi:cystathionine beta-lyase